MSSLFMWVGCQPAVVERGLDDTTLSLAMNYPKKTFTLGLNADLTLLEAGLSGKREALFLQESGSNGEVDNVVVEEVLGEDPMDVDEAEAVQLSEEWASAAKMQKEKLDRQLSDEGRAAAQEGDNDGGGGQSTAIQNTDKVAVFHMLVSDGFDKVKAAAAAQKFGNSIIELYNMGFSNHQLNIELLERYGGRMLRVVNALSERPAESQPEFQSTVPVSSNNNMPTPPTASAPQPVVQESFQIKFAELVSSGMAPNEAAAQALLLLTPPTTTQVTAGSVAHSSSSSSKWSSELAELSAMGFVDVAMNTELLEKYQGRLIRVINTLAGGD
jgi:hypothetical protein